MDKSYGDCVTETIPDLKMRVAHACNVSLPGLEHLDEETEDKVDNCCKAKHPKHPEYCDEEVEGEEIISCREKLFLIPEEKVFKAKEMIEKFRKSYVTMHHFCNETVVIPNPELQKVTECLPFVKMMDNDEEKKILSECDAKVVMQFKVDALKLDISEGEKENIRKLSDLYWRENVFCFNMDYLSRV